MRKIKKYANRKLYDTVDKQYISMEQLADLVRSGETVSIQDNQTGQDITVQILSQLLSKEKRSNDSEMLTDLLSQILRRSGTTIADYAKRYTSKWHEAVTTAEEEIERIAHQLVKDKDLQGGEIPGKKEELRHYAGKFKEWIGEKVDQRISDALGMMKLASKDQVNHLAGEMVTIGERLEAIERLLKTAPRQTEEKNEKNQED